MAKTKLPVKNAVKKLRAAYAKRKADASKVREGKRLFDNLGDGSCRVSLPPEVTLDLSALGWLYTEGQSFLIDDVEYEVCLTNHKNETGWLALKSKPGIAVSRISKGVVTKL